MIEHESTLRLGCFAGVLLLMVLWESLGPKRPWCAGRAWRGGVNFSILVVGSLLVRGLFPPLLAVGMAQTSATQGWGLLNQYPLPHALAVVLSVIALDAVIYLQHVLFHFVPLLWRFHRLHHTDRDLDATSALRFHPIEICLSMGIKLGAIALLGPPVVGVILFEVILNAMAMFNHGNVRIPNAADRALRLFVVTPDMHRVHHSVVPEETNANFGFNISLWDRIFGTYLAQPAAGHQGMTIGLDEYPEAGAKGLLWALIMPFGGKSTGTHEGGR